MKIFKISMAFGGLLLLTIILWKISTDDESQNSNSHTVVALEQDELEAKVAKMERINRHLIKKMSKLELQASLRSDPSNNEQEEDNDLQEEQDLDADEKQTLEREKSALMVQRTLTTMEEAVSAQRDDYRWTEETKNSLYGLMEAGTYQGTNVEAVDCRESLCKISLSHSENEDFVKFRDGAGGSQLFVGNFFFSYDPDTGKSLFYLAKAGQELPRVEKM